MQDQHALLQQAIQWHQAGALDLADEGYRSLAELVPRFTDVFLYWGYLAAQAGDVTTAIERLQRAVDIEPNRCDLWYHFGILLQQSGAFERAAAAYARGLELQPHEATLWNNLGNAQRALGMLENAERAYRRALELNADLVEAYCNLGLTLHEQGRMDEALVWYRMGLDRDPKLVALQYNIGNTLADMGDFVNAELHYRNALQLGPELPQPYINLANVLRRLGKLNEVRGLYLKAIELAPAYREAHFNLANYLQELGEFEAAITAYRQALQTDPDRGAIALVYQLQVACCWDDIEQQTNRILAVVESNELRPQHFVDPYLFISLTTPTTPAQQLRVAEVYSQQLQTHVGKPLARRKQLQTAKRDEITIGYLSADMHEHPVAWLAVEMLESHDRQRFKTCGYAYGPPSNSVIRQRLERAFDRFRDVCHRSHREIAEQIAADGVDILVDLSGYTYHARSEVLALRPAPIQVNFLGYCGTLGGDLADYILVDRFVVPTHQQAYFSERLVHLPGSYQPGDRHFSPDTFRASRQTLGLPEQGTVFACFNSSQKISPTMFDSWMHILREVPESSLWLLEANPYASNNLRREAESRGVAAERLRFAPWARHAEHLARHRAIDLFLDTFPYGAHTTASDALRMGVPLITLCGESFSSRVAGSLLHTLGLDDCITYHPQEYTSLAIRLANGRTDREAIRQRLNLALNTTLQFDGSCFVKHIEQAYRTMWQRYLRGERPQPFSVDG